MFRFGGANQLTCKVVSLVAVNTTELGVTPCGRSLALQPALAKLGAMSGAIARTQANARSSIGITFYLLDFSWASVLKQAS
jgi:hypothetical protein